MLLTPEGNINLCTPSSPPRLRALPPGPRPPPWAHPVSLPTWGPAQEPERTLRRETVLGPALLMSNNLFYDRKGNCLQFHKSETNSFEVVCPEAGRRRFLS